MMGREETGRFTRSLGVLGAQRGQQVSITDSDLVGIRRTDLVKRHFRADAPRRIWVVDRTSDRTWQSSAYVAVITDVFSRRIVGYTVSSQDDCTRQGGTPLEDADMSEFYQITKLLLTQLSS
jgi:putative transposase